VLLKIYSRFILRKSIINLIVLYFLLLHFRYLKIVTFVLSYERHKSILILKILISFLNYSEENATGKSHKVFISNPITGAAR